MSSKRPPSPALVPNPFIKKRNLLWKLELPSQPFSTAEPRPRPEPSTAAIEAGEEAVTDHLSHFASVLAARVISSAPPPRLPIANYAALYRSNEGSAHGAHFVIHQHDHPVAGTHYDLRLQINEVSSASWAIMYGMPGDPNSVRLNRNATETRVHCLWNHLIETASTATGSLLIWDTGTYEVLPRTSKHAPAPDPSSPPSSPPSPPASSTPQALLQDAFQARKIRVRLRGSRLPNPYVLNLRLTKTEDALGRAKSSRPARFRRSGRAKSARKEPDTSSDDEDAGDEVVANMLHEPVPSRKADGGATDVARHQEGPSISAMEREMREAEDELVRRTNAYPGAVNSIGSVHQRTWYLSLDRAACGFVEKRRGGKTVWTLEDSPQSGEDRQRAGCPSWPFRVRGPDHERSVVTARLGRDILRDEGVTGFVARKGWTPVLN